jgi:hypothetical protein
VVNFVIFILVLPLPAAGSLRRKGMTPLVRRWWPTALFFAVITSMPLWIHGRVRAPADLPGAGLRGAGHGLELRRPATPGSSASATWRTFGIGAYAMTLSVERIGWNPWIGVLLGRCWPRWRP